LKLILLILLVGLTSGFGSWLGASFANSSMHVCKANTDGQHVNPENSKIELDDDIELQAKKFILGVVLRQKKLIAQWEAIISIKTAANKEQNHFFLAWRR
jgi:hypothetical protein